MTDYFRWKTLVCEQTKPRTYFTPVFQRTGDRLKLHHMEVDCLRYQQPKKMLPIEHMGKHKRHIFELEDENAKLRELARRFGEYVSQDCCEGCVMKRRCNNGDVEECWQMTEIHAMANDLGIEVLE